MTNIISETNKPLTSKYRENVFYALWFGQMVSIVGSGATAFALRIWTFNQTDSVTQFSLITFLYGLPGIIMSPFAGKMIDSWNKRYVLLISDFGAAMATFGIWALFVTDNLEVWHVYVAVGTISTFGALQGPAYLATLPLLVEKDMLSRANGMWQIGPALDRIFAPLLGGLLMVSIGVKGVTQVDLATFMLAFIVLLSVRLPRRRESAESVQAKKLSMFENSKLGWEFIKKRRGLYMLMMLFIPVTFTQGMVVVLIAPIVLGFADEATLGIVFAISGVGALLGAITMSVWGGTKRKIHGVIGAAFLRAMLLLLGGLQPNATLVAVASAAYLFFTAITVTSTMTIWQTKVRPAMHGRVFAVRQIVGLIFFPLGQILAGPLADNVFNPLLEDDGALASTVGEYIGTGDGRGIGLMLIVLGIFNLVIPIVAYMVRDIRHIDTDLPDMLEDEPDQVYEAA